MTTPEQNASSGFSNTRRSISTCTNSLKKPDSVSVTPSTSPTIVNTCTRCQTTRHRPSSSRSCRLLELQLNRFAHWRMHYASLRNICRQDHSLVLVCGSPIPQLTRSRSDSRGLRMWFIRSCSWTLCSLKIRDSNGITKQGGLPGPLDRSSTKMQGSDSTF